MGSCLTNAAQIILNINSMLTMETLYTNLQVNFVKILDPNFHESLRLALETVKTSLVKKKKRLYVEVNEPPPNLRQDKHAPLTLHTI